MKFSPQDPSAWARVVPYLDQALDLEPHERAAWLKNLETTQPDIARSVGELLSEHAALDARGFLAGAALPMTRLDIFMPALEQMLRQRVGVESGDWLQEWPDRARALHPTGLCEGTVLGAYRLLREIGHGGMSSVWLAQRCDGLLKRDVALKLPYEGPRRAQMAERFKREREILATLNHPNIARLYDAGISALGRSYLAMEYVQGTTLTQYCDMARLSVRERLKVFLQALAAVEFAHTQLVLHRDLKPSNILVTEQGRVVLLDFGIAKLLAPETDPELPLTEMVGRILTPDYASPEHIAGRALGTTSDVYSLGVVLYELLCGARPFTMKDGSHRALEEAVLTQDPPRPSQSLLTDEVASARHTTPRRLVHTLKGDLDTIVLKALKKTPTQRYPSAGAFAQDLNNYLENLPVSARPDSRGYRIRRFIARHKLQVSAATVTLLAIIGGGATAAWQARVAQSQAQVAARERDNAVALASRNAALNDFMNILIAEAASSAKPVTVNEMLVRSEQLVSADTQDSNENRAAILTMLAELHSATSGDAGRAVQLAERALALVRTSKDSGLRSRLACNYAVLTAGVRGTADAAIRIIDREIKRSSADAETAVDCLSTRYRAAYIMNDAEGALRYATLALQRYAQVTRQTPVEEAHLLDQVGTGHQLKGDNGEASRFYENAMQKYRQAGRGQSPGAIQLANRWALLSMSAGEPKRALTLSEQILSIQAERDPEGSPPAAVVHNRARALELMGRYKEAGAAYESARQLAKQAKVLDAEASCLLGLASVAEQAGDWTAARQYLKSVSELLGSAVSTDLRVAIRWTILQGRLDLAAGKPSEARAAFDRALGKKGRNATTISAALGKAEVELLSGDPAAAVAQSQDALNMATFLQGGVPYSNHAGLAWLMLGRALQARGDIKQARKAYEMAITHLSNTVDADHPELLRARQLLASSGGGGAA